jgi:hypothetical protein
MAERSRKRDGQHTVLLRVPMPLWEQVKREAQAQRRSASGQAVVLLQEGVRRRRAQGGK